MSESSPLPELTKGHEGERAGEWQRLLEHALTAPGRMGATYNRFYSYSYINCLMLQLQGVNEPVATYKRWQQLGRQVQKGSKAKTIMRPIIVTETADDGSERRAVKGFKYVRCLFGLSETTGEPLPPVEIPEWNPDTALAELGVTEVPFELLDGNTQGYSFERTLAINPVAAYPLKTLMHELGHIVLGHTAPDRSAEYVQHRGIAEFQAEATAYLVMKELDQLERMNEPESRAYIQNWLRGQTPDGKAMRQVFGAVETILKAGRAKAAESEAA